MKVIYSSFLLLSFLCISSITLDGQKDNCSQKYIHQKSDIENSKDLQSQFNLLDSLIKKCNYEDKEWINSVVNAGMELETSISEHSFPWSYYVFLYRIPERNEDARKFLERIIDYNEENGFDLNGDFYIEMGIRYGDDGNFANQLEAYQKGLESYKRDASVNIVYALVVLGKFHLDLGDLDKAKMYALQAYDYSQTLENISERSYNAANALKDLGEIYFQKDSLEQVEKYYANALKSSLQQHNYDLTLSVYDDLIGYYCEVNSFQKAEKFIEEADAMLLTSRKRYKWQYKPQYEAYHQLTKSKYSILRNSSKYSIDPSDINTQDMSIEVLKEYYEFAISYTKHHNQIQRALGYSQQLNELVENQSNLQKVSAIDILLEQQTSSKLQSENNTLIERERKKSIQQYIYLGLISFLGMSLWFLYSFLKKSNQYNISIKEKREMVESQYNELERISYAMTHDLKEPINTVNSFTDLVLKKHVHNLDEKGKKYFDIIHQNSNAMLRSVNSLHNYLLVGKTSELKLTHLNAPWTQAQNNLKASILESNATINDTTLPIANCYEEDIITLFQSLISNSIKYAKAHKSPAISLSHANSSEHFIFKYVDNGIGIKKESKDEIFNLFKRVNEDQEIEGSGIGLANARKIIEKHKGKIWVESEDNDGSTFWFTISKNL